MKEIVLSSLVLQGSYNDYLFHEYRYERNNMYIHFVVILRKLPNSIK